VIPVVRLLLGADEPAEQSDGPVEQRDETGSGKGRITGGELTGVGG
jgi:hypothetical protein